MKNLCKSSKVNEKKDEVERKHWDSHGEFFLTLLGYAVGLGNIWRFPYLCMRNGGGVFLIPYTVAMIVIGYPSFFLELVLGQFSGKSPSKVWSVLPIFRGIGWGQCAMMFIGSISYGHLLTWILYYFGMSFYAQLPWASCNNTWNTENCFTPRRTSNSSQYNSTDFISYMPPFLDNASYLVNASVDMRVSPGEEFLRYNVLELTDDVSDLGGIRWQLVLCHLAGWAACCLCVINGVQSTGKVAYVTAIAPYILLTVLLIRSSLLPGSIDGIMYYINPEWSKLLEFRIWVEAAIQIFYSVGISSGGNITFSSYNKFNNNTQRDTFLIVTINCLTSFYGGFAVFAVVGYMAHESGIPVDEVIKSGPGLAFIVYPEALSKLPLPQLWSALFFLMLATLAIGTQFGHLQTVVSGMTDGFPHIFKGKDKWILLGHCILGSSFGLIFCTRGGMYWFQLIDWYGSIFGQFTFLIIMHFSLSWLYGHKRLFSDIEMMVGRKPLFIFKIFWAGLTPAYILVVFIYFCTGVSRPQYAGYVYPDWATAISSCIGSIGIVFLVLFAIIGIAREKGNILQRLKTLTRPNEEWGPQDPSYREMYEVRYGKKKDVLLLDATVKQAI